MLNCSLLKCLSCIHLLNEMENCFFSVFVKECSEHPTLNSNFNKLSSFVIRIVLELYCTFLRFSYLMKFIIGKQNTTRLYAFRTLLYILNAFHFPIHFALFRWEDVFIVIVICSSFHTMLFPMCIALLFVHSTLFRSGWVKRLDSVI